tara:strand:+ start:6550 stop:8424 length:1875 start_codon:yes stop_codon:yes gene_type:complete
MAFAGIARPIGLIALASLIPFIILYLRKQKPIERVIPSLMFLIKNQQKSKRYSFFKNLFTNLLFFLQLLALLGLSIAVAAPFIKIPYDASLENTVIVLDVSGSMSAKNNNGRTRFDEAISIAKRSLSGKNSIILAENAPLIVLEDDDTEVALEVLGKVKPKATSTNLGDALLLAKDIVGDRPSRIVLISDFKSTEGPDVKVVRTAIASDDRVVDFVDVSVDAQNVGIVRLESNKQNSKIFIRNFNSEEKNVQLSIKKNGQVITNSGSITIGPNSIENFVFDTSEGVTEVELTPHDDLEVDDYAYVASPPKLRFSTLLVTNEKDSNLEYALSASRTIRLNVVNPPVLTINNKGEKIDPFAHDVIIVYNVNSVDKRDGLLPGTYNDFRSYVEKGGNLVISAQEDIQTFDTKGLLNVDLKERIDQPTRICVNTVNQVTKNFAKESCFTTTSRYFAAESGKDTVSFASAGDHPIITFSPFNKGNVVYYGIIDQASDFKTLPAYPVFWDKLVNFLVGAENIVDFNFIAGKIAIINEQEVKTPTTRFTTSKLLLDEVGIYEYDNKKFAVNMLNSDESDVSKSDIEREEERRELTQKEKREKDFNLELALVLLVFFIMVAEIFIVKIRGGI